MDTKVDVQHHGSRLKFHMASPGSIAPHFGNVLFHTSDNHESGGKIKSDTGLHTRSKAEKQQMRKCRPNLLQSPVVFHKGREVLFVSFDKVANALSKVVVAAWVALHLICDRSFSTNSLTSVFCILSMAKHGKLESYVPKHAVSISCDILDGQTNA